MAEKKLEQNPTSGATTNIPTSRPATDMDYGSPLRQDDTPTIEEPGGIGLLLKLIRGMTGMPK